MLISFRLAGGHLDGYIKLVTLKSGYKKDGDCVNLAISVGSLAIRKFAFRRPNSPFQNHCQHSVVTFPQYNTPFSRHSRPSSYKS